MEIEKRSSPVVAGLGGDSVPKGDHRVAMVEGGAIPHRSSDIVTLARSWLGTPYVHQASVKSVGCDCLGLLRGVWRELHGTEPETPPPYRPDWAEATGRETLYTACTRHLFEIEPAALAPGDIALFRMTSGGPAKHCGIVASHRLVPHDLETCGPHNQLTLIHARQQRRVIEEPFGAFWRQHLAFAFRMRPCADAAGSLAAAQIGS